MKRGNDSAVLTGWSFKPVGANGVDPAGGANAAGVHDGAGLEGGAPGVLPPLPVLFD